MFLCQYNQLHKTEAPNTSTIYRESFLSTLRDACGIVADANFSCAFSTFTHTPILFVACVPFIIFSACYCPPHPPHPSTIACQLLWWFRRLHLSSRHMLSQHRRTSCSCVFFIVIWGKSSDTVCFPHLQQYYFGQLICHNICHFREYLLYTKTGVILFAWHRVRVIDAAFYDCSGGFNMLGVKNTNRYINIMQLVKLPCVNGMQINPQYI